MTISRSLLVAFTLCSVSCTTKSPKSETHVGRTTASNSALKCQAAQALTLQEMTPEKVTAWLTANHASVPDLGAFICCLPEAYRKNFLVGHLSIAGQPGSPESPRVIMDPGFDFSNEIPKEFLLISVNGGAQYLNQNNSLEMAYYKRSAPEGDLNFFDLDFAEVQGAGRASTKRNPESCMLCHGDYGTLPKDGPRAIFAQFGHWPRFVGGAKSCSKGEDAIQTTLQKTALQSLLSNPRFKCLDTATVADDLRNFALRDANGANDPLAVGNNSLQPFDHIVFTLSSERIARIIRHSQDFEAYKFIVAATGLTNCVTDLSDWMPEKIIAKHKDLTFVDQRVLKAIDSQNPEPLLAALRKDGQSQKATLLAADAQSFIAGGFNPSESPLACESVDLRTQAVLNFMNDLPAGSNRVLRAYAADSKLRQTALVERPFTDPYLRFIFEGRGIDMNNWNMDVIASDAMINASVTNLIDYEPAGSKLKEIFDQLSAANDDGASKKACSDLKARSMAALSQLQ